MSASEGRELVEWDWLESQWSTVLHHASLTDDLYAEINDGQIEDEWINLTCGRRIFWPLIPGLSSRMALPRCARCCNRLGYPQGFGSPKNDKTVRPLVEARLAAKP